MIAAGMQDFGGAFGEAIRLIVRLDGDLVEIVALSLRISLSALVLAALLGLPVGAAVAVLRFPGRGAATAALDTLMGLPPVVVGLAVYLALSRAGPLGEWGLLYTPSAMIVAQTVLVAPIVAALARQTVDAARVEYEDQLLALGLGRGAMIVTLLWETRLGLVTVLLAGFGRAVAEVGAVIVVGGNIDHVTRVMTTAIALETSKGNLRLALGLGIVLLLLVLAINGAAAGLRHGLGRSGHA